MQGDAEAPLVINRIERVIVQPEPSQAEIQNEAVTSAATMVNAASSPVVNLVASAGG